MNLLTNLLYIANSFAPLQTKFDRFFNDALSFAQGLVVVIFTLLIIYYKIREASADAQTDQIYSAKTKGVLVCLVFIFLAKPIVTVFQTAFK